MSSQIETAVDRFLVGVAAVGVSPTSLSVGSGEDRFYNGVTLKADAGNDGVIYIRCGVEREVSSADYPLAAGESVTLHVDELAKIRCVATEADQVLHWIGS